MNKTKLILPVLAFAFATTGAFVTNSNALTLSSYYQVLDDPVTPQNERNCVLAPTNEDDCSTTNPGAQCTINISGNPLAWSAKVGVNCCCALKLP